MKTNLIFKKQVTIDGVTKVVTKVIPVEIPNIDSGEGWMLSGHTDEIEIYSDTPKVQSVPVPQDVKKFESNVQGTAKLVRTRDTIKIVARKGKTTYNQTTPDSVCISDFEKQEFFRSCRDQFGSNTYLFEFKPSDGKMYEYWSDFMIKEYASQRDAYIKRLR